VLRVNDDPAPHGTTPRELVMVAMHLKGWVNKEIAKALGVGIHWVKNCTRAVYDKIPGDAVRTQIELLLYDDIDGGALRRAADFQFDKWARGR
jgi:DNA-binding NarL/FixJ family response regulator